MTALHAAPTGADQRLEQIDALRGFALLGILLANILYWSGWILMPVDQRVALAGEEAVLWQGRLHILFIDGKFYTLFSLLFGLGFAMQLARLSRRGIDGVRIYRRRVLILLGIGLVHSWLIWDGDILTLYALLGLLLPWFERFGNRTLLWLAALLIFAVPPLGIALFEALGWAPGERMIALSFTIGEALGAETDLDKAIAWLRREDFMGWFSWQMSGTPFSWGVRLESWRIPKVLGIMLLGMATGRRIMAGGVLDDRHLLTRVAVTGLAIGLVAGLAYAASPDEGQSGWPSLVGTVPLALAYAALFLLAWPRWQGALRIFVPVGRMALTNYLTHSVVGAVVFFGIGFGLVGHLEPPGFYAFALALFAAQVWFSRWWLARYAQGPAEALWRRATYSPTHKTLTAPAVQPTSQ